MSMKLGTASESTAEATTKTAARLGVYLRLVRDLGATVAVLAWIAVPLALGMWLPQTVRAQGSAIADLKVSVDALVLKACIELQGQKATVGEPQAVALVRWQQVQLHCERAIKAIDIRQAGEAQP